MRNTDTNLNPLSVFFRDVVLTLGGVVATRDVDEETLRRLARGFERAFTRARSHAERRRAPDVRLAPHPEIVRLLALVDAEPVDDASEEVRHA